MGLNRDILGSEEYCIDADRMTPKEIAGRLRKLFAKEDAIRTRLAEILPQLKTANLEAAESLRPMIERGDTPQLCGCRVCRQHDSG